MYKSIIIFALLLVLPYSISSAQTESAENPTTALSDEVDRTAKSDLVLPRFPGCEQRDIPLKYKYLCAQKRFVAYLERLIKYPKEASNEGIQGKVIASFIIETDGTISDIKIDRTPNIILSDVCLEALNTINPEEFIWTPAELNGIPVRTRIEVPIDFKLGYKTLKSKKPVTVVAIPDLMKVEQVNLIDAPNTAKADLDKVYDDVEERPYFGDCKTSETNLLDRFKCSRSSYMAYISKQIQYPDEAKRNRIQGLAKVEGIIERDGSISNPKLLRDPGSGLGEEALRLVGQMKDSIGLWTPGEVGGIPVRTRIELPIVFQLKRDDIAPLVVITDSDKNVLHDCIRVDDISVLESIDGVAIKELSSKKSRLDYGEKGRYGVFQVKLPKGKGRLPSALRKQEEVEAFEMYFDGLVLDTDQRKLIYSFNELSSDANIVVYNVGGRTIAESMITMEDQLEGEIDLSSTRSKLFFVSIIQKDLVHTRVIKL